MTYAAIVVAVVIIYIFLMCRGFRKAILIPPKIISRADTMMFDRREIVAMMRWFDTHVYTQHGAKDDLKITILRKYNESGEAPLTTLCCTCGERFTL